VCSKKMVEVERPEVGCGECHEDRLLPHPAPSQPRA
jgi:hypothetical protein